MALNGHRLLRAGLLAGALPALAAPDAAAQGFFGSAGVSVDQGYESNLFATPDGFGPGASDTIMRVGPSVEGGYRSQQVDLIGRYTLATERYAEHIGLSRRIGQQDARVELVYAPTRQLALGGTGFYLESSSLQELISGEALILGRVPASRLMAAPALTYDFNPWISLAVEYEFSREALADQAASITHAPHLGIDWRRDPRTTWQFLYRARQFGAPGDPAELSQTWVVGWERSLSRFADVELQGGARLFEGEVRPELLGAVRRRLRQGQLHFTASESETSMLGQRGIMNTRSVQAGVSFQVARYVRLTTSPSLFRTWIDDAVATVRGVELEATAYVARGVTLVVSGLAARQQGNLGGPVESVPFFSVRAGVRVLYPGRPREDMARDTDEREREDGRRPGARAR